MTNVTAIASFKLSRIAKLNDAFRKSFEGGRVVLTNGVSSLPEDEFPGNNEMTRNIENLQFIDTGIEAILSPGEDTTYTSSEEIIVQIRNFGNVPISDFWVYYTINESAPVGEMISGTILSGESLQYTFVQVADLSAYQSYTIVAYTQLTNDVSSTNDSATISLVHNPSNVPQSPIRKENIKIYPNPTSGLINLSFEVLQETESIITIRNLLGKIIWQERVTLKNGMMFLSIDMSNQPTGIFFISFESRYGRITRKILRE